MSGERKRQYIYLQENSSIRIITPKWSKMAYLTCEKRKKRKMQHWILNTCKELYSMHT